MLLLQSVTLSLHNKEATVYPEQRVIFLRLQDDCRENQIDCLDF